MSCPPTRLRLALLLVTPALSTTLHAQGYQHVLVDPSGPADAHVKAVGDLDGDGFQDLVIAGKGGQIFWYEERTAHPSWTRHVVTWSGGGWSTDAECGDVDGDGDVDLVVSDWYQSKRIGWFENQDGAGGAWAFRAIGAPRAHDIELADFDGDGDLDVVTRQQGTDGKPLEFWRNDNGASSWAHASFTPSSASDGEGLHVADLDGDGDPDIVMGRIWLENTGGAFPSGSWATHVYAGFAMDPETVPRTGDLNGDGRLDIVTTPAELAGQYGKTRWFEAPSDPKTSPWPDHVIDASVETVTHSLGIADMDLDGDLDVVTAEMHQGVDPDEVRVYSNLDGHGGSWSRTVIGTTGSHSIRVVDLGGDGDYDVFGANWTATNHVDVWENHLRAPLVGRPFCNATSGCPCGNDGGAGRGCSNSSGTGAALLGYGSASVSADDLRLVATPFAVGKWGVLLMADDRTTLPVGDGRLCLGGNVYRFAPKKTDLDGSLIRGKGLVQYTLAHFNSAGQVLPGSTWGFQAWCRDPQGPCSHGSNLSAGLEVTFLP